MTVDVIAKLETFLETRKIVGIRLDSIMQRARRTSPDQRSLGDTIFNITQDSVLAREWLETVAQCRKQTG